MNIRIEDITLLNILGKGSFGTVFYQGKMVKIVIMQQNKLIEKKQINKIIKNIFKMN